MTKKKVLVSIDVNLLKKLDEMQDFYFLGRSDKLNYILYNWFLAVPNQTNEDVLVSNLRKCDRERYEALGLL